MCFSIAWMVASEFVSRKSVDVDCSSLVAAAGG